MVATATAKTARVTKAAAAKAETPATEAKETDAQKRNRLRNEAERHILNEHKEEFDDYAEALFAKNGLTFNRRLTEAQKAEKKINDLIAAHPELEAVLRAQFAAPAPTDADVPADPEQVPAVPGGPLDTFRAGDHDAPDYSAEQEQYDHSRAEEAVARVEADGYVDPFQQQG